MESLARRLQERVTVDESGCHLFSGTRSGRMGHRSIYSGADGRPIKAHRAAWLLANGPIPDGLYVLHKCDVPNCVNPDHLFLGTQKDNVADMVSKGRHARGKALGDTMRNNAHFKATRPRGEKNTESKLTNEAVVNIRAEYAKGGVSQQVIASKHGVSQRCISLIVRGETWSHVKEGFLT